MSTSTVPAITQEEKEEEISAVILILAGMNKGSVCKKAGREVKKQGLPTVAASEPKHFPRDPHD